MTPLDLGPGFENDEYKIMKSLTTIDVGMAYTKICHFLSRNLLIFESYPAKRSTIEDLIQV